MSEQQKPTGSRSRSAKSPSTGSTLFDKPRETADVITLFFDACLSTRLPTILEPMLHSHNGEAVQMIHHNRFFAQGTTDDVWGERCKTEGWIVFTKDQSRSNVGPKLRDVCRERGVLMFSLSSKLGQSRVDEHARAFAAVWNKILAARGRPAANYTIRMDTHKLSYSVSPA